VFLTPQGKRGKAGGKSGKSGSGYLLVETDLSQVEEKEVSVLDCYPH
jgi:hypothetical protein